MKNEFIKLKDNIPFSTLNNFGFEVDPANCEDEGDHYYHLNNYFCQIGDFRITINMINRHIDILCLPPEAKVVYNIFNLKPLYDLFINGMVEIK